MRRHGPPPGVGGAPSAPERSVWGKRRPRALLTEARTWGGRLVTYRFVMRLSERGRRRRPVPVRSEQSQEQGGRLLLLRWLGREGRSVWFSGLRSERQLQEGCPAWEKRGGVMRPKSKRRSCSTRPAPPPRPGWWHTRHSSPWPSCSKRFKRRRGLFCARSSRVRLPRGFLPPRPRVVWDNHGSGGLVGGVGAAPSRPVHTVPFPPVFRKGLGL